MYKVQCTMYNVQITEKEINYLLRGYKVKTKATIR
jgi:hypothetical protein